MTGEAVFPRPSGLRSGILESEVLDLVDRFDWVELGVVTLRGLKPWPISISLVLVLVFHRGRLSLGVLEGRGSRPVGVAELCRGGIGDGEARLKDRGGCPALKFLLAPAALLLPLERIFPFLAGVVGSSLLLKFDMITEDAGELPGVSLFKLPMVDRSFETILEIESLSCWFLRSD